MSAEKFQDLFSDIPTDITDLPPATPAAPKPAPEKTQEATADTAPSAEPQSAPQPKAPQPKATKANPPKASPAASKSKAGAEGDYTAADIEVLEGLEPVRREVRIRAITRDDHRNDLAARVERLQEEREARDLERDGLRAR